MAEKKKKNRSYHVRYDRIAFTALILTVLILMLTSCINSCGKEKQINTPETYPVNSVEDGRNPESTPDFVPSTAPETNYASTRAI